MLFNSYCAKISSRPCRGRGEEVIIKNRLFGSGQNICHFRSRISVKQKRKEKTKNLLLKEMKLKLMAFASLEGRRDLSRLMVGELYN